MSNFKYAGIEAYDINNGKGFGVTLFTQGCPHHCPGCHNPGTWSFDGGRPLDAETINRLETLFADDHIRRLTISGGEPFASPVVTLSVASMFKNMCPVKALWVYTGFTWEELLAMTDPNVRDILSMTDILVDGPYRQSERDLSLPFRGSANQRIIDVQQSLASGCVTFASDN